MGCAGATGRGKRTNTDQHGPARTRTNQQRPARACTDRRRGPDGHEFHEWRSNARGGRTWQMEERNLASKTRAFPSVTWERGRGEQLGARAGRCWSVLVPPRRSCVTHFLITLYLAPPLVSKTAQNTERVLGQDAQATAGRTLVSRPTRAFARASRRQAKHLPISIGRVGIAAGGMLNWS